jgi:hypothetical protein
VSPGGPTQGIAFITPTDKYLGFSPPSATQAGVLFDGSWDVSGSAWSFAAGSVFYLGSGSVPITSGLYGSGTVTAPSPFQGEYRLFSPGATPTSFSMDYSVANALAVSPGDMAATWGNGQVVIGIDGSGVLSGSANGSAFGTCAMSGSVVALEPGANKNLFAVSITLTDVAPASCLLDTTRGPYEGYGAITFANTGSSGSPFFTRSFTLLTKIGSGSSWFAVEVIRQ